MPAQRLVTLVCALLVAGAASSLAVAPAAAACPDGSIRCVNRTIDALDDTLRPLARRCDHNAVFALAYLRTTEAYKAAARKPGFFADARWVNVEDWWFAQLYLAALADWRAGRTGKVPPAWRIAFSAADERRGAGAGDLLLGINAHVTRDLPFALARVGLVGPDGKSRKPDHDAINAMLYEVLPRIVAEVARRFDPTVPDDLINLSPITQLTFLQLVVLWREEAWQNAVRLVNAQGAKARQRVTDSIEATSATQGALIASTFAYPPLLGGAESRAAYCAVHHDDVR